MRASRGFGSRSGAFTSPLPSSFPPRRACLCRASVAPADRAPSASAIGGRALLSTVRLLVLLVACALAAGPAAALSLIRDAEIEHTLERIADPLFRAAGVNPARCGSTSSATASRTPSSPAGRTSSSTPGMMTELGSGRPAPRGDRPRARPSSPAATWPGAATALKGARGDRRHRHARRARGRGGGAPEAGLAIAAGTGAGGAAERARLQPQRGGERRPGRPALPRRRRRRPAGDARRARPFPRPGRAALRRQRRPLCARATRCGASAWR